MLFKEMGKIFILNLETENYTGTYLSPSPGVVWLSDIIKTDCILSPESN